MDEFGRQLVEAMQRLGMDASWKLETHQVRVGQCVFLVNPGRRPRVVFFLGERRKPNRYGQYDVAAAIQAIVAAMPLKIAEAKQRDACQYYRGEAQSIAGVGHTVQPSLIGGCYGFQVPGWPHLTVAFSERGVELRLLLTDTEEAADALEFLKGVRFPSQEAQDGPGSSEG